MTPSLPLLVTRPEPGNSATVARAGAMGLDVRAAPLFAACGRPWTAPNPADFAALLLTSAQAPRLAGEQIAHLASLPVLAVGAATAAAARQAGLTVSVTGEAGAQALLDAMAPRKRQKILWLCGRDHSAPASDAIELVALACYAVDPVDPPPAWDDALSTPAVLLAHSARAAMRIGELVGDRRRHLSLVAISAAVASAAGAGWAERAAADTPDDFAMLALAAALCHKG